MEIINLKTAITFRIELTAQQTVAFSTKTFRGKRGRPEIPDPKEHVVFDVSEIVIDSSDPWLPLSKPQRISVLWSNVLSVQYEDVA